MGLEKLFEGQDKIINMHQWVGVGAFFLLIHHPILLAIEAFPYFDATKQYLFFSNVTSYNWGGGSVVLDDRATTTNRGGQSTLRLVVKNPRLDGRGTAFGTG